MARAQIWDGVAWISMTGGAGEDGGGSQPDDNYLRLDGANNNPSPNNYLRKTDGDLTYLPLVGGTISGNLTVNGTFSNGSMIVTHGGTLRLNRDGQESVYSNVESDGRLRWWIPGRELFSIAPDGTFSVTAGNLLVLGGSVQTKLGSLSDGGVNLMDGATIRGLLYADSEAMYMASSPTATQYRIRLNSGGFTVFRDTGTELSLTTASGLSVPPVYNFTTGSSANINVGVAGHIYRSTSARRYKSNIHVDEQLADLTLEPVRFHHEGDDKNYIGFVADDMPTEDAIERNADGEVEGYDLRAVVAILAAKVNQLENA